MNSEKKQNGNTLCVKGKNIQTIIKFNLNKFENVGKKNQFWLNRIFKGWPDLQVQLEMVYISTKKCRKDMCTK